MKKNNFLTITLAVFFILLSVHGVSAQEAGNSMSISGDEICGASATAECSITDLRSIFAGVTKLLIWVGIPAMVMFIGVRLILAYLDLIQGKTMDFKKVGAQIWQAIFGFFVVVAVSTGLFYGILKTFGAQDWATSLVRLLSSSSSKSTTPTATTTPSQELGTPIPSAPDPGTPGSACSTTTVPAGQIGADGKTCYPGR